MRGCCSSIVQHCEENVQFTEGKCNIVLDNVASSFHFNSIDKTRRPMHIAISKATTQIYWRNLTWRGPGQTYETLKNFQVCLILCVKYTQQRMLSVKVSPIARSTFKTHDTSLVNFSPRLPGLPAGHGGLRTEVLRAPAETEVGKMTFLIESGLLPLPRCHVIRQGLRSQARPSPLYRAAAF